jgi:hypothetical protein
MFPRTITHWARNKKDGIEAKQSEPPRIVLVEVEVGLKAQIVGMQCQGFLVTRDAIHIKGI